MDPKKQDTPHRPEPARKQQDPPLDPRKPPVEEPSDEPTSDTPGEHEGATEEETGDLTGPGAGYDNEPEQDDDSGGISAS